MASSQNSIQEVVGSCLTRSWLSQLAKNTSAKWTCDAQALRQATGTLHCHFHRRLSWFFVTFLLLIDSSRSGQPAISRRRNVTHPFMFRLKTGAPSSNQAPGRGWWSLTNSIKLRPTCVVNNSVLGNEQNVSPLCSYLGHCFACDACVCSW